MPKCDTTGCVCDGEQKVPIEFQQLHHMNLIDNFLWNFVLVVEFVPVFYGGDADRPS
jgi:hypothetical protein